MDEIRTGAVQYLEHKEFAAHVKLVNEHGDQFILDPGYLSVFHSEFLSKASGEGKKENAYVFSCLCPAVYWTLIFSL